MAGVLLPEFVGSGAAGWQLVDYLRPSERTPAAANGTCTADFGQLASDEMWIITRGVAGCSSTTKTKLRLYEDYPDPDRYLDGSNSGNFDVTEYAGGLLVWPSTSLIAVWTGASTGAVGTLRLQGQRLRRA